jgi:catechol 2,3-dioxygenase-like lactoylglutathione lyase family enzyme
MVRLRSRRYCGQAIAGLFLLAQAATAAPPLPVAGIARVGYRVADAAKAQAFYSGVLGFPRLDAPGGAALYKVSDQQYVEIAPGLNATEDVRLTYVALETTDIRSLHRLLRSRGLSAKAPAKDAQGDLTISLESPEGTRIEFVEYRAGSVERAARGKFLDSPRISSHLQHVGVIVERDKLETALRFYRDGIGCTEFWRYEPTPGDLRLVKLMLPGERHDIIELMIHSGPLDRASIGDMHHINFQVSDIHAAHRFVLAHGAVLSPDFRPQVNAEDIWAFDLTDPDGTRIEVQDLTKIPKAAIHEETLSGRKAWVLANGWMRVSLLEGGGHIAEVRLLSDDPKKNLNPMRVPHYLTIEPYAYDPARDDAVYGTTPHRWLSSGYMGHLLCFPMYGPPSADEARAGLGNHGEAPIVRWRKVKDEMNTDGVTLWYGADLPKTQFRVERAVTLPRGMRTVYVQEWVENLAPFDRPINWMEHATFGPPFVEPGKTVLDSSGTAIAWEGKGLAETPSALRVFQPTPHSGTYYAMRTDPARKEQFFTLYHPDYRVVIGYVFPSEGNDWINDWQENHSITEPPWNGQVIARGIEFGSSPFAEGLRASVERGSLLGAPAYRWIGGHQRLKTEFTIFLDEIPTDYQGVANVHTEHGIPIVTPRK